MKMFRAQMSLMLRKRGFQVSFTVVLLYVMYIFVQQFWFKSMNDIDVFDYADLGAVHSGFLNESGERQLDTLLFFFPFIAVLPFSFSLYVDKSTRISDIVISRCGRRRYYFSKLMTAFVGSFLIFFIPIMVSYVLTHIFYAPGMLNLFDPNYGEATAGGKDFLSMRDTTLELIFFSPFLGETFAAFLFSLYAGACGMLALALSNCFGRVSVLIFVPVYVLTKLFELGQSVIKVKYDYTYFQLDPVKYAVISSDNPFYGRPIWLYALTVGAIILLSAVMTLIVSRRDRLD
ncbi:MAG: hypothetical protein IJ561_06260 [Ruminococcus sp.]|nr:hypothetical protein [Ruminococcus sp.]